MSAARDDERLVMAVADGWIAVPTRRVQAIHPARTLTALPGVPRWLRGLAWIGEAPVGVIDVAALLDRGETHARLLVRLEGTGLALAAASVQGDAPDDATVEPLDVDALVERISAGLGR